MDSDSDLSSSFFSFSSSDNDSDSGGGGGKKLSIKTISLICAISGPVANGIVNILDKIVVSGRVHHTGSYVGVLGFLDVIIG